LKPRKLALALVALALCGVVALAGMAFAATPTKVTITGDGNGEYHGKVKSTKRKCKANRTVKLYKQRGSEQRPRTDNLIGSDTTSHTSNGWVWNTGNTGVRSGKVYAHVGRIAGCRGDNSRTIQAS
jgi:hypothetical protein